MLAEGASSSSSSSGTTSRVKLPGDPYHDGAASDGLAPAPAQCRPLLRGLSVEEYDPDFEEELGSEETVLTFDDLVRRQPTPFPRKVGLGLLEVEAGGSGGPLICVDDGNAASASPTSSTSFSGDPYKDDGLGGVCEEDWEP
uniref:Uncharacterized protein n=1 Tax=Alexandrium andersonii TaxID=327968 RepID=A0A7S2N2T6_9DINO